MKCPNCKTEMTTGWLISNGTSWEKHDQARGGFSEYVGVDKLRTTIAPVVAWKCESCNKVELEIVVKK